MIRSNAVDPTHKIRFGGGKIDTALNLIEGGRKFYNEAQSYWQRNFAYTVSVQEDDQLYAEVHDWLLKTMPHEKHRSLTVSSKRSSTDMESVGPDSVDGPKVEPLRIRFDDKSERKLLLEGHVIRVALHAPEVAENAREIPKASINFQAKTYAGQQAVIRQLEKLNEKRKTTRKAVLRMVNSWGSWRVRSDIPPRTMQSVSLPQEQKDRIRNDLDRFLSSEQRYNDLAIPWHRGFMFYGPPGTGKTSLVKALANEFNLDLWYISLSDLSKESSLLSLLADVGPRSILLLEDIDTIKITHDRDAADQGSISTSSLLNTLDGVATPHGLITMMTTNRFDILDPAIKRAGRMDLVEELSWPTISTLSAMFEHFFKETPAWANTGDIHAPIVGLSTGQVAELMKRHMDSAQDASVAIVEALHELRRNNG